VGGRTFVLRSEGLDRPLTLVDLHTLERAEIDSIEQLEGALRERFGSADATDAAQLRGLWTQLTPAESRVAVLAASGLSNKAVALALGVRVRTVESHLTSTYRKLGVKSRRELGAVEAI
jgi:DNA-binding NarL/FixJ family response regulator